MPAKKVALLPYFADERFWDPALAMPDASAPRPMICSAGLEFRDYTTLIAATRDLDVDVRIGAASHWARHNAFSASSELPTGRHGQRLQLPATARPLRQRALRRRSPARRGQPGRHHDDPGGDGDGQGRRGHAHTRPDRCRA